MTTTHRRARRRRGFSLVEMLVAIAILSTLMVATLAALDASFKGYRNTTETASTHVVARLVMARMGNMIRTGTQFDTMPSTDRPSDADILSGSNWATSNGLQFLRDDTTIVRLERRGVDGTLITDPATATPPFELWYVELTPGSGGTSTLRGQAPLITGLRSLSFRTQWDVGFRMRQCTVDMVIEPGTHGDVAILSDGGQGNTIRMVTTFIPRRLDLSND